MGTDGTDPTHAVIDETVIRLDDDRYWLYAAVDPNHLRHVRLDPAKDTATTSLFLSESRETRRVDDAVSPVDGAP